jgi:hypothetical protein
VRLLGYSIGERMTAALAVSALRNAIALRDPVKTIVHSDGCFFMDPECYVTTFGMPLGAKITRSVK